MLSDTANMKKLQEVVVLSKTANQKHVKKSKRNNSTSPNLFMSPRNSSVEHTGQRVIEVRIIFDI